MTARTLFKSALVIRPGVEGDSYPLYFQTLIEEVQALATLTGSEWRILLQHSLKRDEMGILAESGRFLVGGSGGTFEEAVDSLVADSAKFRSKHATQQKKKRAAGAKNGG